MPWEPHDVAPLTLGAEFSSPTAPRTWQLNDVAPLSIAQATQAVPAESAPWWGGPMSMVMEAPSVVPTERGTFRRVFGRIFSRVT